MPRIFSKIFKIFEKIKIKFHKSFFLMGTKKDRILYFNIINPLTSSGEVVSVFTSPYLSAGAPALGETKGLMRKKIDKVKSFYILCY